MALFLLLTPFWLKWNFFNDYRPNGWAFFWIPTMVLGVAAFLSTVERDRRLVKKLLLTALLLKVAAVAGYTWMTFDFYGNADNGMYFDTARIAPNLEGAARGFSDRTTGTNFILRVTWILQRVLGHSFSSLAVAFGLVALLGAWLFYRAAEKHRETLVFSFFLPLLLFWPSYLFWSATIGKEALIVFFMALFCWGLSSVLQKGLRARFLILGGLGLFGTMMVRPHIAAMLALAAFSGFTLASGRHSRIGTLGKIAASVLLGIGLVYMVLQAQVFLRLDELSLEATTGFMASRIGITSIGGSAITIASLAERVVLGPIMLFRPFPWESSSPMALASSVEAMLMLWLFWARRRNIMAGLRSCFSHPYSLFQLIFIIEFLVAFSSISNWGIISRQRIMIYPMVFWFLSFRPGAGIERARTPRTRGHRHHQRDAASSRVGTAHDPLEAGS